VNATDLIDIAQMFLMIRPRTDLISLRSSCWGDSLETSLSLRRFKPDRDEIWQIVLQVDVH